MSLFRARADCHPLDERFVLRNTQRERSRSGSQYQYLNNFYLFLLSSVNIEATVRDVRDT